jgi:5-methylcytosine-specific restriction enzyme subunit McrC
MSAGTLTLFEHERKAFDWTEGDLAALERLRAAAGAEVLRATFDGRGRALQATQYVGVVRLGGRAVQVLPKMYRAGAGGGERAREATRNLLHLLSYAWGLRFSEHALAPLLRRGGDWFEILTRLFATHLLEEWQRGAHRHYLPVEDVLPVLKGKWLVAESLRRPARAHLFPVAYDEFTADNALNRVFRFTVEGLWRATRDADNRRLLGELRQWMDEVSVPRAVTARDAAPALVTRLNRRFEPLLNLARLFLAGGSLQLSAEDFETYAFAFDMNRLFEGFVAGFIRRHRDLVLPDALRACELLTQSVGAPHYLARDPSGRPAFQLRPDLAFRRGAEDFPLLLDTKYKRLDPADRKLGISPADFYQMHAYARRYRSPRVLLLYPQPPDTPSRLHTHFTLEGGDATIEAATINLRVDLGTPAGREGLAAELKSVLTPLTY